VKNLPKLFGSSGIRGLINVDLTPTMATKIGLAIATYSRAKTALIAQDTRTSGFLLADSLVSGLLSGGTKVKDAGIMPTPALAFLTRKTKADVGVMITASHNPPEYNGIKIFNTDSTAYDENSQNEIETIIEHRLFSLADWQNIGEVQTVQQDHLYVETITRKMKLQRKWRVIVDPGCGATFSLAPSVLRALKCKGTALNAQPDGFFPARSPEPSEQSLTSLSKIVRELGADIAFAYDGDGDRAVFIDEKGELADFDRILAAYAAYVTKKNDGGIVVTNVEASMCIEEMVQPHGGKVIRTRVGDIYISEVVRKQKAIFGGEPCGAWIHPQFHYCPDGILSSVLLLKALDQEGKTLGELIAETPKYPTLRKNFRCSNEAKLKTMQLVGKDFPQFYPKRAEVTRVDGVRISLEDGWILIRASGTEPLIRLTAEGESLKAANRIMEKGIRLVEQSAGKVK
jgi:phosphoglucosamine mutase